MSCGFLDIPRSKRAAILASTDVLALQTLRELRARSIRLPGEISVIGFDDVPDAAAAGLTTMAQPLVEKGRAAQKVVICGESMSLWLLAEEPAAGPWRAERLTAVALDVMRLGHSRAAGQGPVVLTVDGRSSGGKTTLAARLQVAVAGSALAWVASLPAALGLLAALTAFIVIGTVTARTLKPGPHDSRPLVDAARPSSQ